MVPTYFAITRAISSPTTHLSTETSFHFRFFSQDSLLLHCLLCVLFPSVREYTPSALSPASLDSRQPTFFDQSSRSSRFSGGFHMCDYIISVPHNELREFTTKAALWLIQSVPFPSPFPLSPLPSPPPPPYDSMKSFVWFTTILLLCVELAHAAHITPAHVHRQHRRTPTKPNSRSLRRRATRTCNPPTTNTTDTGADNDNTSNPSSGQVDVATNDGFPSLGFDMPSSVPSSLDGWWSDYESEIGFLGFSYAVSGCTSPLCSTVRR